MSIDYNLAKKLKDSGFPQKLHYISRYETDGYLDQELNNPIGHRVATPTLSELLNACGGRNLKLTADSKGTWYAGSYLYAVSSEGKTPEEAVAKLWLALNKK